MLAGAGSDGRERREESTKLDYERKVKTLLKMLERANKWFGPDFRKSNLLVRRQTDGTSTHLCQIYSLTVTSTQF